MSESETASVGRGEVWIEKYRPRSLSEVVGQTEITDRLRSYVERDDLPHLLFSGPAGVGKCVVGETPILTNRGVERIEDVVGDIEGFGAPESDLEVATFDENGDVRFVEPSRTFSKSADRVVSVTTRDGGDFSVTPEHPVLTVDEEGLTWKQATELSPGDRIARPRRTPSPESDGRLDWLAEMDPERTFVRVTDSFARTHAIPIEANHVGTKKRVLGRLRQGEEVAEIAAELDVPKKTVRTYEREFRDVDLDDPETWCSLAFLETLDVDRDELESHVEAIRHVVPENNNRSPTISPPETLSPALAAFVGLAISEARIDGGRIRFYNTNEALLDRFERAAVDVFDVDPVRKEDEGVPYVDIGNRTLTHFLESCFDVFAGATTGDGLGSTVVCADEESRAAFLRAVFDAEAHVQESGTVELTQKNERLITLLGYLLATFGVTSRRDVVYKAATNGSGTKREYHRLRMSEANNLARFAERIGFTIDHKRERLARVASRPSNPNYDTIPTQDAVDSVCDTLYLKKSDLLTRSLDPETPGRERYLEDLRRVRKAAIDRLEAAQDARTRIDALASDLDRIAGVPATWVANRAKLEPIEIRRTVDDATGVRSDRLLEYADGRRTPTATRTRTLLAELDATVPVDVDSVQSGLRDLIERLNVPYAHLARDTPYLGTDFVNLLENDDHDLASLPRFETLAERVYASASAMLADDVLADLREIERVADADLYYDTVEDVAIVEEETRVYDLTVPGTHNYVAGNVPAVMHNTTCAVAIAAELYGEDWEEHFLELNASDERGIDVVRDRIKDFARSSFGGADYRIIFLDEADSLTSEAQSALRRTMEQFSHNTRFILSCNYSSQIIDPIQSRCAVFRFSPIPDDAVAEQIREIAAAEGIETTEAGVEALVYAADGDMRRAINALQAAAVMGETVDEDAVYAITSTARPEEIEEMVTSALEGDFSAARATLDSLLTEKGLAGGDVIDQLHRSVWEFDLDDEAAVRLLDRIGEADYRITEGANERVQLEALLASLALEGE